MRETLLTWLKNQLSPINPQALKLLVALLIVLLVAGVASYLVPSCGHRRQAHQQAKATAEHEITRQVGEAAHATYQLDSTRRVTQRTELLRQDSILAAKYREISTTRPARLHLPAAGDLPHEGAN